MKILVKIFSVMLAICCLSGCGQSDFRQSDSMLDLQLEIQNELDNVLGITITACDDPEEKGYFSSAEIKASYGEREDATPLLKGQTYRQTIPGKAIQERNVDTIYLKFSYRNENGENYHIGSIPISKEECWNGGVKRYLLSVVVSITPMP